ncbi:hypothetical protein [Bifidobacterium fermentum]|uniref:Uncharacterized protein n=1 Tax=Bifidobacterium fermentum TaxID=3059035 RepID=A0AB39UFF6_9BIFI
MNSFNQWIARARSSAIRPKSEEEIRRMEIRSSRLSTAALIIAVVSLVVVIAIRLWM